VEARSILTRRFPSKLIRRCGDGALLASFLLAQAAGSVGLSAAEEGGSAPSSRIDTPAPTRLSNGRSPVSTSTVQALLGTGREASAAATTGDDGILPAAERRDLLSVGIGAPPVPALVDQGVLEAAEGRNALSGNPEVTTAFVNVTVLPMDKEQILFDHTVLVEGDRIVAVGPSPAIEIPPDALLIDGGGRYLLPGLVDAHVHLDDTETAPLYLAHGVTTAVNMRGNAQHLDWRQRFADGELPGPTLYTTSTYINAPGYATPDDVQRAVEEAAIDGYDLIKVHGALTEAAFMRLHQTARDEGLPVVGHVPDNLGLRRTLEEGQAIAHALEYLYGHFTPRGTRHWRLFQRLGLIALAILAVSVAVRAWRLWRARLRTPNSAPARASRREAHIALAALVLGALIFQAISLVLPGHLHDVLLGSDLARLVLVVLFLTLVVITGRLIHRSVRHWRDPSLAMAIRMHLDLDAAAAVLLVAACAYWVPLIWRTGDSGVNQIARATGRAGVMVSPTLAIHASIAPQLAGNLEERVENPRFAHVAADVRRSWLEEDNRWRRAYTPAAAGSLQRDLAFMQRLVQALHRAGVPLLAGSDVEEQASPFMVPGDSLHDELALLEASGLSAHEVLRAATVNGARFVAGGTDVPEREIDFGTVEAGKLADLILVDGNPLEDLSVLRRPAGVMSRGRWYSRDGLDGLLRRLEALNRREERFLAAVESDGFAAAIHEFRANDLETDGGGERDLPFFRERTLNRLGYEHLSRGELAGALLIFHVNADSFPGSANVHDSLAEAYLMAGDRWKALELYRLSLEMNPGNRNAVRMIRRIVRPEGNGS
jgi:hypothetical protein